MSKNICTLTKWFPSEILDHQDFFDGCKEMEITGLNLITRINILSNYLKNNKAFKFNHILISENEMHVTVSICYHTFLASNRDFVNLILLPVNLLLVL